MACRRHSRLLALAAGHFLVLAFAAAAAAQSKLEPPPANLKVAEQADRRVRLAVTGIRAFGTGYKHLQYAITNTSAKTVWGLVLTGLEQSDKPTIVLGGAIQPNATQNFGIPLINPNTEANEKIATVDFVLFRDGTFWGPDSAGESEAMRGIFEGQRAVVADAKRLLETDAALRELLTKEPYLPELTGIENKTKRQQGFVRGYGAGVMKLRMDLNGRGDLKGVPSRIAEMEENLGLAPPANDHRRQISRSYWFDEPIKIESLFRGNKRLEVDEKFEADSEWLKGLTLRIRNNSGRNITYLSLALEFPETIATGNLMMFPVHYGFNPVSTKPTSAKVKAEVPILPDGSFDIVLGETEFGYLKKFVESRQSMDSLKRVDIRISMIHFSDGTGWNGSWMKQDPENPRRWLPISKE